MMCRKLLQRLTVVALPSLLMSLSACSVLAPEPPWKLAVAGDGPGELDRVVLDEPAVSNLPKSRHGNPGKYEVFGRQYVVLDTAEGFTQQGLASWYGSKFHGRPTSSGEIYDMHRLTAAHKHLPLPTFVRVTRIDNGQSVVVRVNDRGPFVGDRIIDLSYAAAARLDMLDEGKAEVRIEALSSHEPLPSAGVGSPVDKPPVAPVQVAIEAESEARPVVVAGQGERVRTQPLTSDGSLFLQVGAFAEQSNAHQMASELQSRMQVPARIRHDGDTRLYQVQVGPLDDQDQLALAEQRLALAGIRSFRVRD